MNVTIDMEINWSLYIHKMHLKKVQDQLPVPTFTAVKEEVAAEPVNETEQA